MSSRSLPPGFPNRVRPFAEALAALLLARQEAVAAELATATAARDRTAIAALRARRRSYSLSGKTGLSAALGGRSTIEDLFKGNLKHPPACGDIDRIADHLGCTLQERNRLLGAGGCPLVPPAPAQPPLDAATMAIFRDHLHHAPYPALLLDRAWNLLDANVWYGRLFGAPEDFLGREPERHRHLLYQMFAPDSVFHDRLSPTPDIWELHARISIRAFKQQNAGGEAAPWYREKVDWLCRAIPDFGRVWPEVAIDSALPPGGPSPAPPVESRPWYVYPMHTAGHPGGDEPPVVYLRFMRVILGDAGFPVILGVVPADDASRAWFRRAGLPDGRLPPPER